MLGSSRSGAQDFIDIAKLYKDNPEIVEKISTTKRK